MKGEVYHFFTLSTPTTKDIMETHSGPRIESVRKKFKYNDSTKVASVPYGIFCAEFKFDTNFAP